MHRPEKTKDSLARLWLEARHSLRPLGPAGQVEAEGINARNDGRGPLVSVQPSTLAWHTHVSLNATHFAPLAFEQPASVHTFLFTPQRSPAFSAISSAGASAGLGMGSSHSFGIAMQPDARTENGCGLRTHPRL